MAYRFANRLLLRVYTVCQSYNYLRNHCIKGKIYVKIVWYKVFEILGHLPYLKYSDLLTTYGSRLGGLVVSALDFQAGYHGFESRSGRDNYQTISKPSSYSACPGLSIKWTGKRLVTDSGTKCAWVIHGSKAVQIHVHNNRHCLYWVPGSVKNLHNNNYIW